MEVCIGQRKLVHHNAAQRTEDKGVLQEGEKEEIPQVRSEDRIDYITRESVWIRGNL